MCIKGSDTNKNHTSKDSKMSNLYFKDLHKGTIDALKSVGKEEYIEPNYDYAKLYAHLGRKYVGVFDEDTSRDIMFDAFASVFGKNLKVNFKRFSGFYQEREVTLSGYIANLFGRQLINLGKLQTVKSLREADTVDSEGNDLTDNLANGYTNRKLGNLSAEIGYLYDRINDIENRLANIEMTNKTEKKLKAELDRLYFKLDGLEGKLPSKDTNIDDGVYTIEEEIDFEDLKGRILHYLRLNETYTKLTDVVLEMLCEGYSPTEISKYTKLNILDIENALHSIKESVIDYANAEDSGFRRDLIKATNDGYDFTSKFSKDNENIDLDKSVKQLFGFNIREYL